MPKKGFIRLKVSQNKNGNGKSKLEKSEVDILWNLCYTKINKCVSMLSRMFNISKDDLISQAYICFIDTLNCLDNKKKKCEFEYKGDNALANYIAHGVFMRLKLYILRCDNVYKSEVYLVMNNTSMFHINNVINNVDNDFNLCIEDNIILKKAFELLNDFEKKLIFLRYIQGVSCRDISRLLGKEEVQIARTTKKALNKMKNFILCFNN